MMTPIERIKGRCRIDTFTGCWIWVGATSPSNGGRTLQPRMHSEDYTLDPSGKTKTVQTGNRAAWHAYTGQPITKGHRVFKAPCCTNGMCVNPEHMRCGTTEDWGRSVARKGIWRGSRDRINANRILGKMRAKLTPEQVLEIQGSSDTGLALAARFGVSRQLVSRIRNHQAIYARQAIRNPWEGLMA